MCNCVYSLHDHTCRQLENERVAALERTRILEERHQEDLENERAASAERTRILEERLQRQLDNEREGVLVSMRMLTERLQRESVIATSATNRSRSLEAENARLHEFVLSTIFQLVFFSTRVYLLLFLISGSWKMEEQTTRL